MENNGKHTTTYISEKPPNETRASTEQHHEEIVLAPATLCQAGVEGTQAGKLDQTGHHRSHPQSALLNLESRLRGANVTKIKNGMKSYELNTGLSWFQTWFIKQNRSYSLLDHPWFNSLVPCLTWFWMVLLCFDTPGPWHCWTHLNSPHKKNNWWETWEFQRIFTHPSWFPSFPIMFSNRSCPNLFYFSTGPPLV